MEPLSPAALVSPATKRAMRKAGLDPASVHTLRHYAESRIMPSDLLGPPPGVQIAA